MSCIISIHDLADNGLDLGERADRVETLPELRRAGTPVEVTEEVNMHLHGRKAVRRRDVVVREMRRKLLAELEQVVKMSPKQGRGRRSRSTMEFFIPLFAFDFALRLFPRPPQVSS